MQQTYLSKCCWLIQYLCGLEQVDRVFGQFLDGTWISCQVGCCSLSGRNPGSQQPLVGCHNNQPKTSPEGHGRGLGGVRGRLKFAQLQVVPRPPCEMSGASSIVCLMTRQAVTCRGIPFGVRESNFIKKRNSLKFQVKGETVKGRWQAAAAAAAGADPQGGAAGGAHIGCLLCGG